MVLGDLVVVALPCEALGVKKCPSYPRSHNMALMGF